MKARKWYSASIKPDRKSDLIVMTDMGYVFQACYEDDGWHTAEVVYGKVYFHLYEYQDCIVKWMKF